MSIEKRREYSSYEEYKNHQMEKTSNKSIRKKLQRRFNKKVSVFQRRFSSILEKEYIKEGQKVICLGARMGEEVQAFQNLGLDAIGVDLVPSLPLVIKADFNNLPFEDESFDFVYSNSFDHAFDVKMFLRSVERILKKGGHFALDLFLGENAFKNFEVTYIESTEDIKKLVCESFDFDFVEEFLPNPRLYRNIKNPEVIFKKS